MRSEAHVAAVAEPLAQFIVDEVWPSYWRVTFRNGPVNLLDADSVLQLTDLVTRIEEALALTVVVFDSAPGEPGNLPGQHVDIRLTAPDGYQTSADRSSGRLNDPHPYRFRWLIWRCAIRGDDPSPRGGTRQQRVPTALPRPVAVSCEVPATTWDAARPDNCEPDLHTRLSPRRGSSFTPSREAVGQSVLPARTVK